MLFRLAAEQGQKHRPLHVGPADALCHPSPGAVQQRVGLIGRNAHGRGNLTRRLSAETPLVGFFDGRALGPLFAPAAKIFEHLAQQQALTGAAFGLGQLGRRPGPGRGRVRPLGGRRA